MWLKSLDGIPVPEDSKKVLRGFEGVLDAWKKSIEKEI